MSTSRRPSLLWRLFVVGGVGTATAVSVSDAAWERWKSVFGEAVPRETIRNIAVGTAGLHAVEAGFALVTAKSKGVEKPGRWAFSTLLWGFPVLRRLRKAKKLGAAPATMPRSKKAGKKAARTAAKAAVATRAAETGAKDSKGTKRSAKKAAKKATKAAVATKAIEAGAKGGRRAAKKAAKATVAAKAAEAGLKSGSRAAKKAVKKELAAQRSSKGAKACEQRSAPLADAA